VTLFPKKSGDGVLKSVFTAYLILVLHVALLAGLGLLVLFFRGVVQYMLWIFLAGAVLIAASGYLFWRRMKAEGKNLREMLRSPTFAGRSVEVSLLGGLASLRLGRPEQPALPPGEGSADRQLPWEGQHPVQELAELARLKEDGLLTADEYERAKQKLLRS